MRTARNPNDVIEARTTPGEQIADADAHFGRSWTSIIILLVLVVYISINVELGGAAWDRSNCDIRS